MTRRTEVAAEEGRARFSIIEDRSDSGRGAAIAEGAQTMTSRRKPNRRQFLERGIALAAGMAEGAAGQVVPGPRKESKDPAREWRQYGGDPGASRYSPLDQVNRSNVKRLKIAWTHHTEDSMERPATTIECEPIVVDGVMYVQTAQLQTRALDAASGKPLWNFQPPSSGARRRA